MATVNNTKPILDVPFWQMMSICPVSTADNSFVIPSSSPHHEVMFSNSATAYYLYHPETDGWVQIKNSGIAGAFGPGTCGCYHPNGPTGTATAGTATTLSAALALYRNLSGFTIRITGGTGAGQERIIASATGGTITVTEAWATIPDSTSTFLILSGRYWVFNPGTSAVGFSYYDYATDTWTSRSVTGLPTAFATAGGMACTPGTYETFASGTANTFSSTTIGTSTKTWSASQWINAQVRITGGTGVGQIRTITANTATTLTVATWTTTPDATSTYVIEGNDDYIYLIGNNAVTLYRYSISGNSWSTLTPGVARGGAAAAGLTIDWVHSVPSDLWTNESNYLSGRALYSFRGGTTAYLDRYDIAANTWAEITYAPQQETFTTGSGWDYDKGRTYILKEATGRTFYFDYASNSMAALTTLYYPNSTTRGNSRVFIVPYDDGDLHIPFVYTMMHSLQNLFRLMVVK